ncbi:hypothetical protein ACQEU3_43165 [Spirillospora sp. CA-253888]
MTSAPLELPDGPSCEGRTLRWKRTTSVGRPAAMSERQVHPMPNELSDDDKRTFTVQQVTETFDVNRAVLYRRLHPSKAVPLNGGTR